MPREIAIVAGGVCRVKEGEWDPYDKSYKHNEDSFLDHRSRILPPSNYNKRTLVDDLDCSAVGAGNNNYMETISIEQNSISDQAGQNVW